MSRANELTRRERWEAPEASRRLREQMREPVGAVPAQDPMDRAHGQAEHRTDPIRTPALLQPQHENRALDRVR